MKMHRLILSLACILLFPLMSFGFDCSHPQFGATIQELNKDGEFIKYKEKDGVSYYNYTGPCMMTILDVANVATSFAFVDDQLYARIVKTTSEVSEDADPEVVLKNILRRNQHVMDTASIEKSTDGDWSIYQFKNKEEKTKVKVKVNNKTKQRVHAFYYEPLREKLKSKAQAVTDPVDKAFEDFTGK
jgi:hypothetical protein